ncbi:uncharacterized protein [Typha angustifolia]|uniref:uncharacterized protein n=1 Tax=Typha angustifolia TaxID=59011 RepID=UPI003C2BAA47
MEEDPLFLHHLRKISPTPSEESIDQVLESLWKTRRTGVAPSEKPHLQSLLNLPTLQDLNPVLVCLRRVIRKCVNEKLAGEDIQNLFSSAISVELRNALVEAIKKFQSQWMEEASSDQPFWRRTRVSYQVKINTPAALASFQTSELSSSPWPRQDCANGYRNNQNAHIQGSVDSNLPSMVVMPLHQDHGSLDNLANLPRLKSMTWTMEKKGSTPANRLAIITLKLQDYAKSASGEIEVKFQVSKDTLDAMLSSMVHLSEHLSDSAAPSVEQPAKKQKQ